MTDICFTPAIGGGQGVGDGPWAAVAAIVVGEVGADDPLDFAVVAVKLIANVVDVTVEVVAELVSPLNLWRLLKVERGSHWANV